MQARVGNSLLIALMGVLVWEGQARAHDFWLEREGGAFLLRYGHHGGASLPLDAGKIRALNCRKDKGAAENLLAKAVVSPKQLSLTAVCPVLSAFLDGGFYSLTTRKQNKAVPAAGGRHLAAFGAGHARRAEAGDA